MQSSPTLFGNDYEINYSLQLSTVACAVQFPRLNESLKLLGMGQLSKADQTSTQREAEQPLAHQAHASMARAWEREQRTETPAENGCLILDCGWSQGRNAPDCTQPTMSNATGRILHLEHSRRSDPGVKSSQSLEQRNCVKTVAHPLITPSEFPQASVDGATATMKTLQKAGFDGQGDPWHAIKARGKACEAFVEAFAPREDLTPAEQAARRMEKPDRPAPITGKPAVLGKPPADSSPPSLEGQRGELRAYLGEAATGTDAEIAAMYESMRLVEYSATTLGELSPKAALALPARLPDLPLSAYAQQLASVHKVYSRQAVMTEVELAAWQRYDAYCIAQANSDAARAARTVRNKNVKQARITIRAWIREFRSVYDMVFRHTASLRGKLRSSTDALWTPAERTVLAQQLYPDACLHLAAGILDAESLITIGHPSTKQKDAAWSWVAPAQGHVNVRSLEFKILESWVRDPRCLDKFSYYIGMLPQWNHHLCPTSAQPTPPNQHHPTNSTQPTPPNPTPPNPTPPNPTPPNPTTPPTLTHPRPTPKTHSHLCRERGQPS